MQPLPDAEKCLAIVLKGTASSMPWANVLHAKYSGTPPDQSTIDSFTTAVKNWWIANIANLIHSSASITSVTVTDLNSRTGLVGFNGTATAGSGIGTALPNSVSYCVQFKIARRYRGGHPRVYMPAMIATQQANATQVTAGYRTSAINAWTAFKTAIEAYTGPSLSPVKHCSISYYSGKDAQGKPILRTTPIADIITGYGGDLRMDSQRHRLGKPS